MKALFTGDWHVGAVTHSSIDKTEMLPTRLLDCEDAIQHVWHIADAKGCQWIIVLGDVFHISKPPPTYIARVIRLLRGLLKSFPDIGVLMFPGNHDYNGKAGQEHATAPIAEALSDMENFTYVSETATYRIGPNRTLHVVPHGCEISLTNLDPDEENYLLCHTTFEGATHGVEEILLADQARDIGEIPEGYFDAIFSGHIHKAQAFEYRGQMVFYPGSIDRVDFGERAEEKSVLVVDFDANESMQWNRVVVPGRRPFVQIDLTVDESWVNEAFVPQVDVAEAIVKVVVHVSEESLPRFQADSIRNKILGAGANFVAGFQMDIRRSRQVKDAKMTESLTLDQAFNRYVERNVAIDDDMREEIIEVGKRIIKEANDAAS